MDDIFRPEEKRRRITPAFLIGLLVGAAIIAGVLLLLARRPSIEDQTAAILAGAYREGSPEFAALFKDIVITRSDDTFESPTGLGTISMFIKGRIKNRSQKNITVLEVNVSVVDLQGALLKDKNVLVVPQQQPVLPAGETIPISLTIDGFDPKSQRADIRWKVTAVKAE